MHGVGRFLIAIGIGIFVLGVCALIADRFHLPLGRLPGDFTWRGKNSAVYFPLGTSILLSVLLSLLFYLFSRIRR